MSVEFKAFARFQDSAGRLDGKWTIHQISWNNKLLKKMKHLICSLLLLVTPVLPALGSLYAYPKNKRPAVTLAEACEIAARLLETQGDEKQFYVTRVSLFGSKEQDGSGAWNLQHDDKDGNSVNVYIPFPTGNVGLHYYPHDYSKNGGDKEVDFNKTAKQTLAEKTGTGQPAIRPDSKGKENSQPEAEGRSR